MALIEEGRVCIVTQGADAGKQVVIERVIDKNFVQVVGERVKSRKCNVRHLEPTQQTAKTMPTTKARPAKEKKPQTAPAAPAAKPAKAKAEKKK